MGSLGFALGGAIAGAGQGLNQVGNEMTKGLMEQKLQEMRQNYESSLQQKGFAHAEAMQGKQQEFELARQKESLAAGGALKRAEMEQAERLAKEHEKGASERTHEIAQSRITVGAGHDAAAAARGNAAAEKAKQWTVKNVPVTKIGKDGTPEVRTIPVWVDPVSHAQYVQAAGGKLVLFNGATGEPAVSDAALSRIQPKPEHLNALFNQPDYVIPQAYKAGGGLTNRQMFEQTYHYLPPGFATHGNGGSGGGAAPEADQSEQSTAGEDMEDSQAAEGEEPGAYGVLGSAVRGGYNTPQHQASDDTPAQ